MSLLGSIFAKHRSGILYEKKTRLTLGNPLLTGVSIKLPCILRISQRKRVTITDVPGLTDTVKQVQGLSGYDITITTHFGDYTMPGLIFPGVPLVAKDSLADLAQFIATEHGPVKILDEDNILESLHIAYVVFGPNPLEVDQDPTRPGVLNVSLFMYAELMPHTSAREMLTEEEP